jgi:hypothetical protein
MVANTGLWVGVSIMELVWGLMVLVIVAAVVVGGRIERGFREAESDIERTSSTSVEVVGRPRGPLAGKDAALQSGRANLQEAGIGTQKGGLAMKDR